MIPFLAAMTFPPAAAAPPAGMLAVEFPGGATIASMGTGDSILVTATYDFTGDPADELSFQVIANGGAPVQWANPSFAAADFKVESSAYSSADAGWIGAGTYQFYAVARRVSTGLYDVFSNVITLTVS